MSFQYVELDRAFIDFQDLSEQDGALDPDSLALHARHFGTMLKWPDLYESQCVVVLGEARSGKTFEFKHQGQEVGGDEPRFYLPVESLASEGLDLLLDSNGEAALREWIDGSGNAFFFLDAVDEAKLRRLSLANALRKLRNTAGRAFHRARIFISCRVSDWRPTADLEELQDILPAPEKGDDRHSDEDPISPGIRKPPKIRVVFLAPLNPTQIEALASAGGVEDTRPFIEAIDEWEAGIFGGRPGDIAWLAEYWSRHGRLASFRDLMEMNVIEKLRERNSTREPQSDLPGKLARDGVDQLAAAATLSKRALFLIPDDLEISSQSTSAIDSEAVLPHWSPANRIELLDRAIFDEATYGRVGFHHRTVREYLTACWFQKLLDAGYRRKRINQLFFADLYGQKIVRGSLEPVLGWLSTLDDETRREAIDISPVSFVTGGDPRQLNVKEKATVLERIAEISAVQPHILREVSWHALRRFSHPDLTDTVTDLIRKNSANKDLLIRLVGLIEAGRMVGAKPDVLRLARSRQEPRYLRTAAIDAAVAVCTDEEVDRLTTTLIRRSPQEEIALLAELAKATFPSVMTADQLLIIVSRAGRRPKASRTDFDVALAFIVRLAPPSQCSRLLTEITEMAGWQLSEFEGRQHDDELPWLAKTMIALVTRTISTCRPNRPPRIVESTLETLRALRERNVLPDYYLSPLKEALAATPRVRQALFWKRLRERRKLNLPEPEHWRKVVYWSDPWEISQPDCSWLLEDVSSREDSRDRELALKTAFSIYGSTRDPAQLKTLREAVLGEEDLSRELNRLTRDLDNTSTEIDQINAKIKREEEKEARRKASQHKKNRKDLETRIEGIRDGSDVTALTFLWDRLPGSSSWGRGDPDSLVPAFGKELAAAFKVGLMSIWTGRLPKPHREDSGQQNIPPDVYLGLSAIKIAVQDGLNWKEISARKARAASELALWEMNSHPEWLELLAKDHSAAVALALGRALDRGLKDSPDDEGRTLQRLRYSSSWLRNLASPSLEKALQENRIRDRASLESALGFLLESNVVNKKRLLELCKKRARVDQEAFAPYWATWLSLEAESAVRVLEKALHHSSTDPVSLLARLQSVAIGSRYGHPLATSITDTASVPWLSRLIHLCYRYLEPNEDVLGFGGIPASEEKRAAAQEFRDKLLKRLAARAGEESYLALQDLAEIETLQSHREHLLRLAAQRIAEDAELTPWEPEHVPAFVERHERPISTSEELFCLLLDRLDDLRDDVEKGDFSPRVLFRHDTTEAEAQVLIARELKQARRGQYTVHREEEVDRLKKPDIRANNPAVEGPVGIEVKIADRWTVVELEEALDEQLVGKYLKAIDSQFGVLLLVHVGNPAETSGKKDRRKPRYWLPGDVKGRLSFAGLVERLQTRALSIVKESPSIKGIAVVGIDFL